MLDSYQNFLESTVCPKVHLVSPIKGVLPLDVNEPSYLISTSGSQNQKHFLHSLSGIKKACESFLKVFPLGPQDRWVSSLPTHHVGGFSIMARSHFGGLKKPLFLKWDLATHLESLNQNQVTVTSLVPAQVYDLVKAQVQAPSQLKYAFVGGAALSQNLIEEFKKLNWPMVLCYGSTETFAQMAYSFSSGDYTLYPGWTYALGLQNQLNIQGPGTPAYEWSGHHQTWEKVLQTVALQDRVEFITGQNFRLIGRAQGSKIKIKGAFFDFNDYKIKIEKALQEQSLSPFQTYLVALEEPRSGAGLYLISTEHHTKLNQVLKEFSKIRGVFLFNSFEGFQTELGKIQRLKLQGVLKVPLLCV